MRRNAEFRIINGAAELGDSQSPAQQKGSGPIRAKSGLESVPLLVVPNDSEPHGVTVKLVALMAVPPGVVMAILPVNAPVGTIAVTCVSEFTVKVAAFTPNITFVV